MAVTYQDYYETLGVERSAPQDKIQSAYRKLARKYHPDINKNADAEEKFKQINEAYEVLGDPEKRKKYDQLGHNWQNGDDFTPPPGWDFRTQGGQNTGDFSFEFGDSGFSDFFESLFGGFGRHTREQDDGFGGTGFSNIFGGRTRRQQAVRGQDHEAELTISLEDAYRGGKKSVTLSAVEHGPDGRPRQTTKSYQVTIPKGVTDGKRLRLPGQGGKARSASGTVAAGDLYLTVRIGAHPRFSVHGKDIEVNVPVTPWEAALGSTIQVPLVQGSAEITLPEGIESGKRIRLKGKGLGNQKEGRGDLYARIQVMVPKNLTAKEKELFEQLAKTSSFKPRG